MLQAVVRELLPQAVPVYASLDGVKELSARTNAEHGLYILGAFYVLSGNRDRMLPVEADLSVALGALSVVSVGGEESVFEIPTGERLFARRMVNVRWAHHLTLQLARAG